MNVVVEDAGRPARVTERLVAPVVLDRRARGRFPVPSHHGDGAGLAETGRNA